MTCEKCRHSIEGPIDPNNLGAPRALSCRRYPPQFNAFGIGNQVGTANAFPTVQVGQSCGEFDARLEAATGVGLADRRNRMGLSDA